MFHKIKAVTPFPDRTLLVQFAEGISRQYDVKPLFEKWAPFRQLSDDTLWKGVSVDPGGYGISWNEEIDLSCDELFENGAAVSTPFDGLLSFGDATALWGIHESTLRKAVAYGKLKNGVDAQKFGKQWIVTEAAMLREYGPPKAKAGE